MVKIQVIETLFFNILTYSFILPVLAFVIFFNKLKTSRIIIAITVYYIIFFSFLFFDDYLSANFRYIYNFTYTTLEYSFFAFFISQLILSKKARNVIFLLSIAFILFQVLYFVFAKKSKTLDSVPIGIETILILTYLVFLFFEQFKKTSVDYIYSKPWFAFIIGIMIYLACSFFFNIMASSVGKKVMNPYWFITYIFEIVKNVLFAYSIFLYSKSSKNMTSKTSSVPFLDLDITP